MILNSTFKISPDMAKGESYEEFVQKFEVKRTTDDSYTPPAIYEALLAYKERRVMQLAAERVLRPFYPGGDYEREDYGPGDVVIDNPPFSILSKILRHYQARGVRYWLFAPHLTCATEAASRGTVMVCNADIEYHNGAHINTSFVTRRWLRVTWPPSSPQRRRRRAPTSARRG